MKKLLFLISIIIVLGVTLFLVVLNGKNQSNFRVKSTSIIQQREISKDTLFEEGKLIFEHNCNMCHKIFKISDPPILRSTIKGYDLNSFKKFIKNEARKRINYFEGTECKSFSELKDHEILNLYNYLNYVIN